jgi:hypothetical protein
MKTSKAANKPAVTSRGSRDASRQAGLVMSQGGSGPAASGAGQPARRPGSRDASRRTPATGSVARSRAGQQRSGRATTSRDASVATVAKRPVAKRPVANRPVAKRPVPKPVGFVCPPCGRWIATGLDGLVLWAGTGSARRFCSPSCRQAAYRRRRAGVAEDLPLQLAGGRDRSLQPGSKTKQAGRKTNA